MNTHQLTNDQYSVEQLGSEWRSSSLVWGTWAGSGDSLEQRSPVDGSLIQRTYLLDQHELDALLQPTHDVAMALDQVWLFAERLHTALDTSLPALRAAMQWETGFIQRDCDELLQGTLDYVRGFRQMWEQQLSSTPAPLRYQLPGQERHICLERSPWGTVAIILPQNAFLLIAVTALLNALATGNRIILRAPQQSARSAALLATAIDMAEEPWQAVSVVLVKARPFIQALCQSQLPLLIHYMGSSQHAPHVLADGFRWGKPALIDGSGNGWMWVGADMPVDTAVDILTAGALRYNGQTCTSINGALIHPDIYPDVRQGLIQRWRRLNIGNPLTDEVDIGPLFEAAQAQWCVQQVEESGGHVLCGGRCDGNLLQPTLVEDPDLTSALVCEGLFGGGLWIAPGDQDAFVKLWPSNRYPLCAGVLSPAADAAWWAARLPSLARLTVNGDPSVEHIFEPWGGYPASGLNPVSIWHQKYQRVVAIDQLTIAGNA